MKTAGLMFLRASPAQVALPGLPPRERPYLQHAPSLQMPPALFAKRHRRLPYVASSLDDYLSHYWCVTFASTSHMRDVAALKRYTNWYAVKMKCVFVDKHICGTALSTELLARHPGWSLPLLFVNRKLIGDVNTVHALDEDRLLKDVLQFGLRWKVTSVPQLHLPDSIPNSLVAPLGATARPLGPLPARHNDVHQFKAIYKGAPKSAPVSRLPQFSPFGSE